MRDGREITDDDLDNAEMNLADRPDGDCCVLNDLPYEDAEMMRIMRKDCYRLFIKIWEGYVGSGVHVELPTCVVCGVHKQFPDPDGEYMGYKER